jgi:hypothetical protein
MRAYVEQLDESGGPGLADEEVVRQWQEGTKVDLTA